MTYGKNSSVVLDVMRRSVPPLEHCLQMYKQCEREQARETHAAITKIKQLKHAVVHPRWRTSTCFSKQQLGTVISTCATVPAQRKNT